MLKTETMFTPPSEHTAMRSLVSGKTSAWWVVNSLKPPLLSLEDKAPVGFVSGPANTRTTEGLTPVPPVLIH